MKIVADAHIPYIQEYFGSYGDLILKQGRTISPVDVKDADLLFVRSVTPINEVLLSQSQVKFVGSITAGQDHLDTKWLDQMGIKWSIAAGFNANPVADYVISTIAALKKQKLLTKPKIKIAIVGVGNAGGLVEKGLKKLKTKDQEFVIELCDPIRAENEKKFSSTPFSELSNLDLISFHVPLTHTGKFPTFHFVDKTFLKRQKPGCILLNTSRGAIINSEDLLAYGDHLLWCFDVWENEPKINKKILSQTLIATPHIAGYSVQSKIRGIDLIYRLACAKKIIPALTISPFNMPFQELNVSDRRLHWEDIVLGVFDPRIITEMMRAELGKDDEGAFDRMRQQFNYRYEFAFTKIFSKTLSAPNKEILSKLDFGVD